MSLDTIMKNMAIIGLGSWGKLLLKEFSKISNVVICMGTGNIKNKKWLKSNFHNIQYTTNFKEILNNPIIDCVVIASPINSHFKLAELALKSNKHIFIEKPLAENALQAQKLIRLATAKKLSIFTGHIFLHHEVFKKLSKLLVNDKPQFAKFEWNKLGTFNENLFLNLAVHELSIILELFGYPKKIKILDSFGFITKHDLVSVQMTFDRDRSCQFNINRLSHEKKKTITVFTKNSIYIWQENKLYKFNKKLMLFKKIFESKKQPLALECKEFMKSIDKKQIDKSSKISLNVLKIIDKNFTR